MSRIVGGRSIRKWSAGSESLFGDKHGTMYLGTVQLKAASGGGLVIFVIIFKKTIRVAPVQVSYLGENPALRARALRRQAP
jgi:hypothetical protein